MRRHRLAALAAVALVGAASLGGAPGVDAVLFPTQSLGDQGADVAALQLLLAHRGVPAPLTGVFDEATREALASFQRARGLPADGVAHDATWAALVVALGPGSAGPAVLALHRQLDAKHDLAAPEGLAWSAGTTEAVSWFQAHAGLPVTGSMDEASWRALVAHYQYPDFAKPHWCVYWDLHDEWGTAALVGHLDAGAARFASLGHGRVAVGDVSLEHGGDIENHSTHEVGLDVDLRLVRTDRDQCAQGCTIDQACYDRNATLALIDALIDAANGHLVRVYVEDAALWGHRGVVRDAAGHRDHLHVRYCEATHPRAEYAGCGGASPAPVALSASATQTRWMTWREEFEHDRPWAFEEEVVGGRADCYGTGLADVSLAPEAARFGTRGLALTANARGSAMSDHVIAMRLLADAPVAERARLELHARIDAASAATTQAGPEFSVQSTAFAAPGVFLTSTAGFQYVPATGAWQVWVETGPGRAGWLAIENRTVAAGEWHRFRLDFDVPSGRYEKLRVEGAGLDLDVSLGQHAIAREAKGWDREGVWATVEAENLWNGCGAGAPTVARLHYDNVSIRSLG